LRHSPKILTRRLASPFFLPTSSSYHKALTVAQLDKADAACAETDAARPDEEFCHAAPRLSILHLLPPNPITFCAGTAPKPLGRAEGRDETPAAHSAPTRREPTATRAYEVDQGGDGGESGAREGGEGGGSGGGGWLSGLSAAAHEVPPDVESGSADLDTAPHGPRCMDPADSAIRHSLPTSTNDFRPLSQGSNGSR
jgi:hypothetical protein